MLKKLYLIRETGQCIYHQVLGQVESDSEKNEANGNCDKDPNLISGFFAAIISFADQVIGEDNNVNNLSLKNSNFYFIKRNHLHYILETDLDNPYFTEDDFYNILNKVAIMIELYLCENNIDDSIVQISEEKELNKSISNIVSKFMRSKIFSKISI